MFFSLIKVTWTFALATTARRNLISLNLTAALKRWKVWAQEIQSGVSMIWSNKHMYMYLLLHVHTLSIIIIELPQEKKYEKSIKKKTSWMAVMVKHACRNWLWLRAYPGASLKVATFRHHHESTRFTIHAFLFINLQHQKKVGPSTARHPTERSCVFVFCDLLASSDGGTLDTAFLVYGLIGCKCHELRNFSDNKNTWRCFLMNPQKTRSGVSKENVLFKCVF